MKITKDIKFKNAGGILDLFDDQMKAAFNITDEEYDYLCEKMTDEEIKVMVNEQPTFSEKRKMIEIRNRYLGDFRRIYG